jgi:hypothetical protein
MIASSPPSTISSSTPTFRTADLNLAAYLRCRGYALVDTERDRSGRVTFVFEDRTSRPQDVAAYYTDAALVPALRFAESARSLKGMLRK